MTTVNTSTIDNGKSSTTATGVSPCETTTNLALTSFKHKVNPKGPNPMTQTNLHTPRTAPMTTEQLDTILLSLQTLYTSRQTRFYANLRQWPSQQITDYIADQQALQQAIDNLFAYLHPDDVEDPHCPECDASGFELCSECGHCDECCDCQPSTDDLEWLMTKQELLASI